jgi:transcriptional regulator with XRE-family HTH domain
MTLDQYLSSKSLTRTAFAKEVGVSRVALQRYLAGERFPRQAVLRAITTATGGLVTANDFVSKPDTAPVEADAIAHAAAQAARRDPADMPARHVATVAA